MAEPFSIGIAGLTVRMHPLYDHARQFCRDYLTGDTEADLVAVSSTEAIAREAEDLPDGSPAFLEPLCLYRQIAEQLPAFGGCVFHGAAIEYGGKAYLFTAPSGTGKSTHIRLWAKHLGPAVKIVNGDKPILRLTDTGVNVCSTPWAGKENWQRNCMVPLGGLCLLHRGETDTIRRVTPADYVSELLRQVYLPADGEMLDKTLWVLDEICRQVPLYLLECTMNETAVITAFEGMTGEKYGDGKDENS